MRTWYGLYERTFPAAHEGQPGVVQFWIQHGSVSDIAPGAPWHGRLVRPIGRVCNVNSDEARAALSYCRRQIRGLNALALAAFLDGMITEFTPLHAYETAMNLMERKLASFILETFKSDQGILERQKQAQDLYADQSMPL